MFTIQKGTSVCVRVFHELRMSEWGWDYWLNKKALSLSQGPSAAYNPQQYNPQQEIRDKKVDSIKILDWLNAISATWWTAYSLDAPKKSEVGIKIDNTKAAILGISQEKKWFLGKIAKQIFRKAEQKWNIKLTDDNKEKFLLGLQAAMEVKDITEKQRYTIVWRFAQGFLGQSNNATAETVEQPKIDAVPSNTSHSGDATTEQIAPDSDSVVTPTATTLSETKDPEALGRELIEWSSDTSSTTDTVSWASSISDIAAQVQDYDAQTADRNTDLNMYRSEESDRIEEQIGNKNLLQHKELSNEEYEMINTTKSDWDPESLARMSPGSTTDLDWSDDGWVSQVRCTRLSGGDFRLQFPDCEYIIDDNPNHPEVTKKEIELIKEVAKTPLVRRLLNMGTGNFNLFRDRVQAKYDPTGKSKENPEQLIKFMLEAILSVTLGDKDALGEWTNKIPRGIFASPNIPLDMIQKSMRYASSSQKLMMSYALAEQWVFDIDTRRFDPSIISRI